MHKILLIVDVQNGFISERTNHIIPRISKLLIQKKFSDVIFTQFINEDGSPYEHYLHWFRFKNEYEQSIADDLKWAADKVIKKNGYTAVTKELKDYILKNDINEIYIAGIDTDCCVLSSAKDIFEMGIRPIILSHYCASNGGVNA